MKSLSAVPNRATHQNPSAASRASKPDRRGAALVEKDLQLTGARRLHSQGVTYDDASWHLDSVLEYGLDRSCAAAHIGMFFAWLAHQGLVDPDFIDVSPLIDRTETPGRFLLNHCAGEIDRSMLTSSGAAFTAAAYDWYGRYYEYIPAVALYSPCYAAPDSWLVYDDVAPAIGRTYRMYLDTR